MKMIIIVIDIAPVFILHKAIMKTLDLPMGQSEDQLLHPRKTLSEENLKSMVRSMGLKVTQQRLSILKILNQKSKIHFTAKDIFEIIRSSYPNLGFATIYRFLKKTSQFGITSELRIGHTPARYELKTKNHHHHIVCTHCGKIVEFQNDIIETQIVKISKKYKFFMEHHIFELYGRCNKPTCQ